MRYGFRHMPRLSFHATALCALVTTGCGTPAWYLKPAELDSQQGAIFGRITVTNVNLTNHNLEEVTGKCKVEFSDEHAVRKAWLSLDDTGWVFSQVKPGPTYLSTVRCAFYSTVSSYVSDARPTDLKFDVPGGKKIAYFGHIYVGLNDQGPSTASVVGEILRASGGLVPVVAGALVSATAPPRELVAPGVFVEDRYDQAVVQYRGYYGEAASSLDPVRRVLAKVVPPGTGPSFDAAGFSLGKDAASAEIRCIGSEFSWTNLGGDRFSCNGIPVDLGVPATAYLSACKGVICSVAVDVITGERKRNELVPWLTKLSQFLVNKYGPPTERASDPLDDCKAEMSDCIATGRVRTSSVWQLPEQVRISLMLDGGPLDGHPTLRLSFQGIPQPRVNP